MPFYKPLGIYVSYNLLKAQVTSEIKYLGIKADIFWTFL